MTPHTLSKFLQSSFRDGRRVLIKGEPGIGKSDIVASAAKAVGADLALFHPAVSDPTDFKGQPAVVNGEAKFLPFNDLNRLIKATGPTVAFLDDIGQSAPAVQAALMQLIQARAVGDHRISDHVVFVGATNDTKHQAGVSGMIEPLKSRWDTIVELKVKVDDWVDWAVKANMPSQLIGFMRFRPNLLSNFKPTRELHNSPCPRTWAAVGRMINSGVADLEVISGAVGEGAAGEYMAFDKVHAKCPDIADLIKNPKKTPVPDDPAMLYAITAALPRHLTDKNIDAVFTYIERMPPEFGACAVKDAVRANYAIMNTKAFASWAEKHGSFCID